MMFLYRFVSLLLALRTAYALDCYVCNALSLSSCHNTILCPDGHECSARTSDSGGNTVYALACTPTKDCRTFSNISSTQFVGRSADQPVQGCNECCSTDGCNKRLCTPIDGSWSSWSEWGACDVTCGNGSESRSRRCDNPSPRNGGQHCAGSGVESRGCSRELCPVDGGWAPWSSWLPCSVSCGDGMQHRTRTCSNPYPARGGHYCTDTPVEYQMCSLGPCGPVSPEPQFIFSANSPSDYLYTPDIGPSLNAIHGSPLFRTIEVNIGEVYNPATGVFTAPIRGVYEFTVVITGTNHLYSTSCKLMQNDEEKMFVPNTSQGQSSSSAFTYLTLNRTDHVQLDCSGWKYVSKLSTTSFHGALVLVLKN